MDKQIKGLLYFFTMDIKRSIFIFWPILLGVLALSLAIAYFLIDVENGSFAFGFPFAIYFYCLILGFLTVKETIPFSLKMGAVRKKLFAAIGIFFIAIAFLKALVATTLQAAVEIGIESGGLDTFMFLHPAMLLENTWLNRLIIDTAIMFTFEAFMFLVGLLFYKYGMAGGGAFCGLLGLGLLLGIAQGWIFEFFGKLLNNLDILLFVQLFGVGVLIFFLSYIFMRRITPVKA